ncbi:MAG TPA: MlaD family protein [Synergistales bacterium]|nr:MlaD family protein [Synergistales bacterium]
MNREFKVGLTVFLALLALGGMVFITGGALFRHGGNSYEILFRDAMGLEQGAPAYVSGIESGAVRSLRLSPEGVIVTVILDPSVRIPKDSKILIGTGGLLGKPLLRIERGSSQEFFQPGDRLSGEIPPDFDSVLEEIQKNLKALGATFQNLNEVLGDPERKAKLGKALDNLPDLVEDSRSAMRRIGAAGTEIQELGRLARKQIKLLSDRLQELGGHLDRVVLENREDVRKSIVSLASLLKRADETFAQFDEDRMAGKEMREAIRNLSKAAKGIEALSSSLSEALGDSLPTSEDKEGRINLKETLQGAARIVSSVGSIRTSGEVALHRSVSGEDDNEGWAMDLSLQIGKEHSLWNLLLEGTGLGNGSRVTASALYQTAWGRVWGGLVRGDVGFGAAVDFRSEFPFSLSAEWWDEQGGSWAFRGKWYVKPRWGFYYERLEPGHDPASDFVGVFYQFSR